MRWKETGTFVPSTAEENYELTHDIMFVLHDVLPYVVGVKMASVSGFCEGTFLRFSSSTPGK